ncbi:MAG: thioredoxin family protein [Planctomycetota bacterium]|jgi:glutaredoxin
MNTRKVQVFVAACPICKEAVELVERIACPSCEVTVLDVNDAEAAERAKALGVRSVPAVAVDGELLGCCQSGIDESTLRAAGIGSALA